MEGDAGTSRLNPTGGLDDQDGSPAEPQAAESESSAASGELDEGRRPTRLGRGWALAVCAVLVLSAVGLIAGGALALRSHQDSEEIARAEAAALAAAKDCVAATQAPDTATMSAGQAKILECSTGEFRVQATLYSGVLVDAYQAADVSVEVSDLRAAVERHHDDGSVDVLVAMRTRVTNFEAPDQEQGYRLRVKMAPEEGTYKISELDQVAS